MHWVTRRRDEVESLVKIPGRLLSCMSGEGAGAGNVCCLQRAQHRIFQKRLSDRLALPAALYGETRQQHDGNRPAHSSGCSPSWMYQ